MVAVASFCGPAPAPGVDDTTEAPASTTRTPRIVDDSGRPDITFGDDECTYVLATDFGVVFFNRLYHKDHTGRSHKVNGGRDWTISSQQSNRYSTLE